MRKMHLALALGLLSAAVDGAETGSASGNSAAPEVKKTVIRPDISKMVKTASGSFHKDDLIGNSLAGLTLEQVKVVAVELGLDAGKYDHLNIGQQRMNLGNALRRIAANPEAAEKITALTGPMQAANAEKAESEKANKLAVAEAKKAEKAAAEAAKAAKKAKVADSTEGEGGKPE